MAPSLLDRIRSLETIGVPASIRKRVPPAVIFSVTFSVSDMHTIQLVTLSENRPKAGKNHEICFKSIVFGIRHLKFG